MRYFNWCASLFAFALLIVMSAGSAQAQATRTWVSGVGDDANPCSRTAPCKTFAGAISKTAPAGEIDCLDPGGFGAVTITKSLTIRCVALEAGVLVSGTNGINIVAGAADQIVLYGLDIEGLGTGIDGVKIFSAGAVYIFNTTIHHFTGNGVNMNSTVASSRVFIQDSIITENAGGVNVNGNGVANVGSISKTLIDGNTSFAVQANGAGNIVAFARSILSNSPTGISLLGGGTSVCFGPSNIITGAGACSSSPTFR
ncbi:MAG TPA: hypothetical protein VGF53_14190 [Pseudolabrys sp.]|jgi:hypothetical protein